MQISLITASISSLQNVCSVITPSLLISIIETVFIKIVAPIVLHDYCEAYIFMTSNIIKRAILQIKLTTKKTNVTPMRRLQHYHHHHDSLPRHITHNISSFELYGSSSTKCVHYKRTDSRRVGHASLNESLFVIKNELH